jgi:hypothetical protein
LFRHSSGFRSLQRDEDEFLNSPLPGFHREFAQAFHAVLTIQQCTASTALHRGTEQDFSHFHVLRNQNRLPARRYLFENATLFSIGPKGTAYGLALRFLSRGNGRPARSSWRTLRRMHCG